MSVTLWFSNVMDIFRREAEKELAEQSFQNRPLQYDLFQISSVDLKSHISGGHLPAAKLERRETDWIGTASLTLVKVVFEPRARQILHTTADDLLELFRCLDLDPYMLYLMYRDVMGYHQVGVRQSIHFPNESVYNFFVNVEPMKVLWSFNPANLTTKGIILPRYTRGGKASCDDFCRLVEKYSPLMAHPVFPAFAAVLEVVAFSDKMINKVQQEVTKTELETGFSPWSLHVLYDFTKPKELDKFIGRSQKMAASLVNLEDVMRQTKMMQRIINALQESRDDFLSGATSDCAKMSMQTAREDIFQVLSLTRPRLEYADLYANNLRERAKNQLTVVSHLLRENPYLAKMS